MVLLHGQSIPFILQGTGRKKTNAGVKLDEKQHLYYDLSKPDIVDKKRVLQSVCLVIDGAAYHSGVLCNLNDLTKKEIQTILITKYNDIKAIQWIRKDNKSVSMNHSVELKDIKTNYPNNQELKSIAYKLLAQDFPYLIEPLWEGFVREYKDKWGPDDVPGIIVVHASPYASKLDFIAVEMVWAYSKDAVASPENQTAENRTPNQIIRILMNAMSEGDRKEFPKNLMRYCAKKTYALLRQKTLCVTAQRR